MIDREKVIKAIECCTADSMICYGDKCQYRKVGVPFNVCWNNVLKDAGELLRADQAELIRQRDTISKYRKADEFLALHGWEWKDD